MYAIQSFKRVEHLKRHSGTHSASLQAGRHQLGGPSVSFLNSKQPSERFNTQDSIDGDKVENHSIIFHFLHDA